MASGYEVAGVDLDSIFAPLQSGWPQAPACKYTVGDVDLNQRYAKLSSGSGAAATEYRDSAGSDLNTYFAAYGSTGVQVGAQPSNVSGSSAAGYPSGTVTSGAASCTGAKGGGSYTYTWHTSGCTATSPSSATSLFETTVDAASTDDASAYCTISDGVTSVNTGTILVTLQNTSPATYTGTLVAGETEEGGETEVFYGYNDGDPAFGSLTPATDINGAIIESLYWLESESEGLSLIFEINANVASTYFTTLHIGGTAYAASAATFGAGSGSSWTWAGVTNPFTEGDSYTVTIDYPG